MKLFSCGGMYYPRLVGFSGKDFYPISRDLTKPIRLFSQSEKIANGHNVIHLKGDYTLVPSIITLPGMDKELKLIPSRGSGTYSFIPDLYSGPNGPFCITGGSNEPLNGYGQPVGLWYYGPLEEGIIYYDKANLRESSYSGLSDFTLSEDGRLEYTQTDIINYNPSVYPRPPDITRSKRYGLFVGESDILIPSKVEGLERLFNGRVGHLFDNMLEGYEPWFHGNYSYVCADACESIRYPHHNVVMNTMEVLNFNHSVGDMYQSWLDLATDPSLRKGASAYLGTIYGPKLTLSELGEILNHEKSMEKRGSTTGTREVQWFYDTFHFSGVDRVSFKYHYGVYNTVLNTLNSWGLSPVSLVDVWDAVPYSFVVDWFVNIGDMLENPARRDFIDTLPVSDIWRSEKSSTSGAITDPESQSSLKYSFSLYCRENMEELGTRLSGYTPSSGGISAQHHLPELGAVLVNLLT